MIRAELNFVRLPLFTLNRQRMGEKAPVTFDFEEKRGKQKQQCTYTIIPCGRHGLGGPFDYQAFRAVELVLTDTYARNQRQLQTPMALGTARHLLQVLGYDEPGEREYEALRVFFARMCNTRVISHSAIYEKATESYIQGEISVYENWIEDDEGIRLWPGSLFLENLQRRYVKLLDREFYTTIRNPLTRRLYEVLSLRAHRYDNLHYRYSQLCHRLQITKAAS